MAVELDDVAAMATSLPEVAEGSRSGARTWSVAGKTFAWERPFTKADLRRFGAAVPPTEPVLAVRVADLGHKDAVLAEGRPGFFTIPHFDGFAAVLVELRSAEGADVREALVDGWSAMAPARLAR